MSDAISKLYAEIGFKVNQDGLKEVKNLLTSFAKQMNSLNKATKEAAKQYGVFSKNQAKQELHNARLATEASRKAVQDKRIQIMQTRELQRQEDRAKREKEKEERQAAKELARQERQQQREADRAAKEQRKRLKDTLNNFRSFAVGLRNTFLWLAGIGGTAVGAGMYQSLGRSIQTRDFLLKTNVALTDLQKVVGGFAGIGSSMSQQQIMSDILGVSQNIQDIALGQGNLAPYKLLSLAAKRNDVMGVISEAGRAVQGLDNPMALNLLRKIGLSDDWLSYFRLQEREGGSKAFIGAEGQADIEESQTALRQLNLAFRNFSDNLNASISPFIIEVSDSFIKSLDNLSKYITENSDEINEKLRGVADVASDFIGIIGPGLKIIKGCFDGLYLIFEKIGFLIGYLTGGETVQEHKDAKYYREKMKEYQKTIAPEKWKKMMESSYAPTKAGGVYIDNRTMNSTINGVTEEKFATEVENVMIRAGYKSNRDVRNEDLHLASDLVVLGGAR